MKIITHLELKNQQRLDPRFLDAYRQMKTFDFEDAVKAFKCFLFEAVVKLDPFYPIYLSYYGVALVFSGHMDGLRVCQEAAKKESLRVEIFANLALAELNAGSRRAALLALHYGLRLNARSHTIRLISKRMNRRPPALSFLSRDHFFNRVLGKITYSPPRLNG